MAQSSLGIVYKNGKGVIKDIVTGHISFNIANSNGNRDGKLLLEDVTPEMTCSQIKEAQRLARECMKKNYKGC